MQCAIHLITMIWRGSRSELANQQNNNEPLHYESTLKKCFRTREKFKYLQLASYLLYLLTYDLSSGLNCPENPLQDLFCVNTNPMKMHWHNRFQDQREIQILTTYCLLACLLACSLARLLACLLARSLACLLACSLARLLACSLARLLACLLARLLACSLACLLACFLTYL